MGNSGHHLDQLSILVDDGRRHRFGDILRDVMSGVVSSAAGANIDDIRVTSNSPPFRLQIAMLDPAGM